MESSEQHLCETEFVTLRHLMINLIYVLALHNTQTFNGSLCEGLLLANNLINRQIARIRTGNIVDQENIK